jgi:UDP-3-O-[3-hydroxymyristoyl] glucosamine N-acyltransferase
VSAVKISLSKLATIVNGRLSGNGELEIISVSSLEHATSNSITFFGDRKKKQQLKVSGAGAVLIRDEHKELFPGNKIIVTNPYLAHAQISKLFRRALLFPQSGVHETAVVSAGAILGSQVTVGAYSTIAE